MSTIFTRSNKAWKRFHKSGIVLLLNMFILFTGFAEATSQNKPLLQDEALFSQVLSEKKVSDEKLMSINFTKVTLVRALEILAERLNVGFSYNPEVMPNKIVSFEMLNVQAHEVIYKLLEGTNLEPMLPPSKDVIILKEKGAELDLKIIQDVVRGTVVDAQTGEALPGVSIVVKGTMRGTTTDMDGEYNILVTEPSAVLVFSFIGFTTQEIDIEDRQELNVALEPDLMGLDEVVVVGYGTTNRSALSGSVSSLNVNEIDNTTFTSIDRALEGKIPGLTVQADGSPGGRVDIRIRGLGTITNNEPLLVVDGVPVSNLNMIDPNTIQSVHVLKDASATAIYGNRASNGVILIETKQGSFNQRAQIQASYQTGVSTMGNRIDMLNASQYKDIMNEAVNNAVAQGILSPGAITDATNGFIPEDNDWQEIISQVGYSRVASVSGMGGSENMSFYLSGNFRNNEGTIRGSNQDRISFTANSEFKLTEQIVFGEKITFAYQKLQNVATHDPSGWGGMLLNAIEAPPQMPKNVNDGPNLGPVGTEIGFYGTRSPMQNLNNVNTTESFNLNGNAYLDFNFLDNLSFRTQLGFTYLMSNGFSFSPNRFFPEPVLDSSVGESYNNYQTLIWDNFLTYNTNLGLNSFEVMLGASMQKEEGKFFNASRERLLNTTEPFRYLNFGDPGLAQNSGSAFNSALQSYFSRLHYDYNNKYLLTATIRADGSTKFTEDNRWGYFPSASLGWNISGEDFLKDVRQIDFLKLRVSYGLVGNQSIGSYYPYLNLVEPRRSNYVLGPGDGSVVFGTAESARGNESLTWETTTMRNIGIDLMLFNRFSMNIDYFNNDTEDLLLPVQLADFGGRAASPFMNVGSVNAQGLEVSFDYTILDNMNWSLKVATNGTFMKNEVTDLGDTDFLLGGVGFNRLVLPSNSPVRTAVGRPIGSFYGYQVAGIFQNQADIDNNPSQSGNVAPGDIKWKDQNGDGVIDSDDRVFLGDGFPDFVFGLSISGAYKNFDFSLAANGVMGVQIYNALRMDLMSSLPVNKHVDILDRWTGEGTSNSIPRVVYNDPANNTRPSDYYIESGDYLRMSTVQLGYNLPNKILSSLGLRSVRTYITAMNLFTITGYSGFNPVVNAAGGGDFQRDLNIGWDTGVYPAQRSFLFGVDINF